MGRPGAGRAAIGAPACATGTAGLGGALYTGRGPVCGTIIRGAGVCGTGGAAGAAGRCAGPGAEVCGAEDTVADGGAAEAGETTGAGTDTGRGGAITGGALATGAAAFSATGGVATTGRGAIGGAGGATGEGVAGRAGVGAKTGFATTLGGAAARTGGATASLRCVMALSTSPGREICDRSILVLISSSPRGKRAFFAGEECASEAPRRCARTFSASCSSRELECVFFSVTPTSGSTSRMALLLTSSSLARSLIRTLLIRPFLYPALCLSLHRSLTEFRLCTRTSCQNC
jgi:hypothetical protein